MKRVYKHGISTGNTIRYVGNRKYCTRGKFELYTRNYTIDETNECMIYKASSIQPCLLCGGSKFSCKAMPHETNQYGNKTGWTEKKDKIFKRAYLSDTLNY